ncbi:ribonuclease E activity regulator RraA [Lentibacillus sp. L22]|uniref:ribonuclease E activity regulator RraA n=1 Tax=Lentibacillus TaxID=175304 RepID=UPI0022B1B43C|nr:ribonuclease E activity regulator RraA [Lentibacillus daqui]
MSLKTTDLCDEFANELSICMQEFQSFGKRTAFSGPISTVKVLEDNVLVKAALETIPKGHVLVVDGGGSKNCALMGDNLAAIGMERGLAGIIIYGCIRDTADINNMDIGVRALGKNPLKSQKKGDGETDIPVTFGGVDWTPGDYVYVDEDGVVVAKRKLA